MNNNEQTEQKYYKYIEDTKTYITYDDDMRKVKSLTSLSKEELDFLINIDDDDLDSSIQSEQRKLYIDAEDVSFKNLYRDYVAGDLILNPDWQRELVWTNKEKSLLIESVILNIPIPPIYLSETVEIKVEVVDGQQRLTSIFDFKDDKFKISGLKILSKINGKKFSDLDEMQQKTINSRKIRAITIKKESDPKTKFDLFHRINSGSKRLTGQEVRNAYYYKQPFWNLTSNLCKNNYIMSIFPEKKRGKTQELISRSLSFFLSKELGISYLGNINEFLTDAYEQDIPNEKIVTFEKKFIDKTREIVEKYGDKPFYLMSPFTKKATFNTSLLDTLYSFTPTDAAKKIDINKSFSTDDMDPNIFDIYVSFVKGRSNVNEYEKRISFIKEMG